MQGRNDSAERRGFGLRWLAAGVVLTLGGAITLALAPAGADTKTVNAELSLSGIATTANILGGSQIGVHPGDTVEFSPSTIPTAGLANIPALGTALDSLLQSILGTATGYQITAHFPANFPGGKQDVTMGACTKTKHIAMTFPTAGVYDFTWSAVAISPLCVLPASIGSLAGNQLKTAGVALNASNQWVGAIVVGNNVNPGGISIQLPGVSIAPSLPGVGQLPTLGVPGINLPTIPVTVPSLGGLPGVGGSSGSSTTPAGGYTYTPPPTTVPEMVVPHPDDGDGGNGDLGDLGGSFGSALPTISGATPTASVPAGGSTASPAKKSTKHVELAASNKLASAGIPLLLMIIAIVALTLVTGTYARLYLMRRPS
jgi:hypothetical protein